MAEVLKVFPSLGDYPGLTLKASINSLLCFGWKELGKKRIHCANAWDYSTWNKNVNDDYELVKLAYEVLSKADAVVTHNGKRFDVKFLQTRLRFHKLPPLPPGLLHIDTCAEAKKHLYTFNNRLNTIAKFLTNYTKLENGGWNLWVDVYNRVERAMKLMTKYCKQDVKVLEEVFLELRPLIAGLPNQNMFIKEVVCPKCGSMKLQKRGQAIKANAIYQRLQCQDCGGWAKQLPKAGPRV